MARRKNFSLLNMIHSTFIKNQHRIIKNSKGLKLITRKGLLNAIACGLNHK